MLKRKGESVVECFESKGKACDSPMAILSIYLYKLVYYRAANLTQENFPTFPSRTRVIATGLLTNETFSSV